MAKSSPGLYDFRLSASEDANKRATVGEIAGETAMKKPVPVKNIAKAENLRIRRKGDLGGW